MKIKDQKMYDLYKEKNKDFYSKGVIDFGERWADKMEELMATTGLPLVKIADSASRIADTDGITGAMYGMAVGFLSQCWEDGESLRRWHNHEYDYEGDGVVNPAIISFKPKE